MTPSPAGPAAEYLRAVYGIVEAKAKDDWPSFDRHAADYSRLLKADPFEAFLTCTIVAATALYLLVKHLGPISHTIDDVAVEADGFADADPTVRDGALAMLFAVAVGEDAKSEDYGLHDLVAQAAAARVLGQFAYGAIRHLTAVRAVSPAVQMQELKRWVPKLLARH